jgi:uncharacterized protein YdhG (YjbR/CyaY superfamily)
MQKVDYSTIDQYIRTFPKAVQATLEKFRRTIKRAAPDAEEAISYQMPTFKLKGNLVHFAAFKNHIGFFPGPTGVVVFKKESSAYETSKGTIRFPMDKPLPLSLVTKVMKVRVKENLDWAAKKKKKGAGYA